MEDKQAAIEIKRDCINLVLSISFTIISYIFLANLISTFYKPDVSLILENNMRLLVPGVINRCKPEPLEKTLFIAGIFFMPVFLFIYYSIFKKILNNKQERLISYIWMFTCLYMITILPLFIYKVLNAPSIYVPPYSNLQLYILNSILDKNISFTIFIIFIVIIYIFLRIDYSPKKNLIKITTILADIFCILLTVYMGIIYVCSIDTRSLLSVHFESVFYSIVQLFKGVPLGVDGFTNSYGLYPYFLNVIFKITGLSVLKCSIVFCTLITLSYLIILFFLKNTVNNKFPVFLGFISVVYLPTLSPLLFGVGLQNPVDPYYQYLPLRYLFPCLLLLVSSSYIKNKKNYYFLSSIICSLSILWNFDTGLIITISWLLLNFYSEFKNKGAKTILKNILRHIIKISAVMMVTILIFCLYVFICYGRIMDLSLLYQTFIIFSEFGFGMLPMPLIHPWNILVLTYIIGIGISIRALIKKDITPWTKNVFLTTIMGAGMLLYYQGRSHDFTFFMPSFYFFILLTLFLDKILSFLKNNKNLLLSFLSVLIASALSLSVIFMSINIKNEFSLLKDSIKNVQTDTQEKKRIEINCDFIRKHSSPSENIIILSGWSGIYFSKIPNISAFNPDITELYLNSDYARLAKIIAESDLKVFAENFAALRRVEGILKTLTIIDDNGYMVLLKKN
ncbi:MAG: hypothetical protein JW976_05870 [Syntrophaceae bacterium]|nr:hypothetical protein [Syntrophaceae bacterium]